MSAPRWFLTALAVVLTVTNVRGYEPPPSRPYKLVSPDEQYVFVMARCGPNFRREHHDAEATAIFRTYSTSGLYRNDGSTVPLWTFDGYVYPQQVGWRGTTLVSIIPMEGGSTFIRDFRTGEVLSVIPPLPVEEPPRFWVRFFWGSVIVVFSYIALSIALELRRRRREARKFAGAQ